MVRLRRPHNQIPEKIRSEAKSRRSPRYPAVPLSEAINAAHLLQSRDKRIALTGAALAKALGYNSYSGIARTMVAAMRQFGLLEKQGVGLRLSTLAAQILSSKDGSDAQRNAVREAALAPALFRDLYALHRGASEEAIRSYLILRRRFTKRGAALAAAAYIMSLSLAEPGESQPAVVEPAAPPIEPAPMAGNPDDPLLSQTLLVSIPRNLRVDVSVHGDRIDKDDLEKIKSQVSRWIDGIEEALD